MLLTEKQVHETASAVSDAMNITATAIVLIIAVLLAAGMIFVIRMLTSYTDDEEQLDKFKELRDFVSALFGRKTVGNEEDAEDAQAQAEAAAAKEAGGARTFEEPCPACGETVTERHLYCPSCGLRIQ